MPKDKGYKKRKGMVKGDKRSARQSYFGRGRNIDTLIEDAETGRRRRNQSTDQSN